MGQHRTHIVDKREARDRSAIVGDMVGAGVRHLEAMAWHGCSWLRTGSELSVIVLVIKLGAEESRRVFG